MQCSWPELIQLKARELLPSFAGGHCIQAAKSLPSARRCRLNVLPHRQVEASVVASHGGFAEWVRTTAAV